jgi:hypothetical protein
VTRQLSSALLARGVDIPNLGSAALPVKKERSRYVGPSLSWLGILKLLLQCQEQYITLTIIHHTCALIVAVDGLPAPIVSNGVVHADILPYSNIHSTIASFPKS